MGEVGEGELGLSQDYLREGMRKKQGVGEFSLEIT